MNKEKELNFTTEKEVNLKKRKEKSKIFAFSVMA
jgi:hypothetical protein